MIRQGRSWLIELTKAGLRVKIDTKLPTVAGLRLRELWFEIEEGVANGDDLTDHTVNLEEMCEILTRAESTN